MIDIKTAIYYLDIYADRSYRWERRISVYSAIASCASIGGWALWEKFNYIWAIVIAISQVINAIRPHFPFSKRLEIIKPFEDELQTLFNEADYNWFSVSNGSLSSKEINDLISSINLKYTESKKRNLKTCDLLENEKILNIAAKKAENYFNSLYNKERRVLQNA